MRRMCVQLVLLVTVLAAPAAAQITVGDNTSFNGGGNLFVGYSGSSGTTTSTTHSLGVGGNGWFHGYYYKPQFLSFDFQPYYQRAQNDSIYQSLTHNGGFTASTSLFSGTHFPGFVSYGKTYDNTGQFGVPGISGITSHGSGDSFSVGWSVLLPHLPTLTASYATATGTSTVYGANTESSGSSRNLNLTSTYKAAGFDFMGQYLRLSTDSNFPSIFEGGTTQNSKSASNSYLFNVMHKLPLAGQWSFVWNHSNFGGEYWGGPVRGLNDGTVNSFNTLFSVNPTHKLGLALGANYNDNAFGALQKQVLETGGAPLPSSHQSLRTLSVSGQASYSLFRRVSVYGRVSQYEEWFGGKSLGMTLFSGNADFNYAKSFLGALTFSVGVIDTASEEGNSGASLVGNVNYLRRIHAWELGANFSYMQQVETLFAVYTTSMYRYGGQVRRKFTRFQWSGAYSGSRSGFTRFAGYSSGTETFSTAISTRRFNLNGLYSKSSGTSILTSSGLVVVPPGVPPPLLFQPVLYNGKSYGGGVGVTPLRRLTLSASYEKAHSATSGLGVLTGFDSNIMNYRIAYRLRKLNFEGNYTEFHQNISTATIPATINVYYIRVSRWFNFF